MAELSGFVQYRFRSDENDADILLRGDADWVRSKVAESVSILETVSYASLRDSLNHVERVAADAGDIRR